MKLKTIAIRASLILLVVVTSLLGAVLVIWTFPSLLIRTSLLEKYAQSMRAEGLEFSWNEISLSARSRSLLTKEISLAGTKICFKAEAVATCLADLNFVAEVRFQGFKIRVVVEDLSGHGEYLNVAVQDSPPQAEETKESENDGFLPSPPGFLSWIEVRHIDLPFPSFTFVAGSTVTGGALSLQDGSAPSAVKVLYDGNLVLSGRRLKSDLKAEVPFGSRQLRLNFLAFLKDKNAELRAEGAIAGKKATVDLTGALRYPIAEIPLVTFQPCRLSAEQEKKNLRLTTDCEAVASAHLPALRRATARPMDKSKIKLVSSVTIANESTIKGKLELSANPLFTSFEDGNAALVTEISGSVKDFPSAVRLNSKLDFQVNHFQRLVKLLHKSSYAVPSPINQMDGTLALNVTGEGAIKREGAEFPLKLEVRLGSDRQSLQLVTTGTFQVRGSEDTTHLHLDAEAVLEDVQLVLPDITSTSTPQFIPDSRIKGEFRAPAAESKSSFTYDIRIRTPPEQPVRLVSRTAKDVVPLHLLLHAESGKDIQGHIRLLPFSIELFRRTATVEKLDLKLTENARNTEVDGSIKVVYADYTIRILILGLVSKPQIHFVSDPPLPEDKALAVLLFGKPLDALDEEQAASVGGTRSALADGAVSLASMYILASTPVESVGYDPISRIFTARVRIADGTTLSVGSNMRAVNEIGIRKRLGNHWTVATYLENPFDPLERTLSAFLEWSKGY